MEKGGYLKLGQGWKPSGIVYEGGQYRFIS